MNEQRASIMSAVENHLKHVIVPILYDYGERGIDQLGCSALIEKNAKLYLLSALHTFEDLDLTRFLIPADCNGGRDGYDLISLWPFDIHDDECNDLVALELDPGVAIGRARAGAPSRRQNARPPPNSANSPSVAFHLVA